MSQISYDARVRRHVAKTCRVSFIMLFAICLALCGCDNSRTIWSAEVKSPDGKWTASAHSVEHRGPGNNDLETVVYLKPVSGKAVEVLGFFHDPNLVSNTINLDMRWATSQHLEVTYSNHPKLYLKKSEVDGIEISAVAQPGQ